MSFNPNLPDRNAPAWLRVLTSPLCDLPVRMRLMAGALALLLTAALAVMLVGNLDSVFLVSDASFYLTLAKGKTSEVMQPWASRQLGALVAAGLAWVMHATVEKGFIVEGIVSLIATLAVVYGLMLRSSAPLWMLLAVAVLPSWVPLVQYLPLPDLWYAALLAVVFVLLARGWKMAACVMMFPLMLSRESTSLTLLCLLAAGWGLLRWSEKMVAVVSAAAGAMVVARLSAHAQPNLEHLPGMVYLVAKIPWNFLRNVVGAVPWSNVNTYLCQVPTWSVPLHFGSVKRVGVCGFAFQQQLVALGAMLDNFGLLPLLVAFLWWRHRRRPGRSLLLRFSLLYGASCLVLAPVLGAGFQHLVGYAWPLFVVALPMLFDEFREPVDIAARAASVAFLALHLLACGASYWLGLTAQIWSGLAIWIAGLLVLKRWFGENNPVNASVGNEVAA